MEKQQFQQIPLNEVAIATQMDHQKSVSPPPPYPTGQSPPNPPAVAPTAIGLERPIGSTVSPPPPYPVGQPQPIAPVPPPYPIQQQPIHQSAPYPPVVPTCVGPPIPSDVHKPIMMQPPPAPHAATAAVVMNAPGIITVGPQSFYVQCPNCHTPVYTKTETEPSDKAVILCVVLCIFGCDLGCCLIPFCVDQLQDVDHKCPRCNYHIAHYNA